MPAASPGPSSSPTYRLADGVALLSVGDRPTLFSPSGEKLYALNPVAAALALRLEAGSGFGDLVEELAAGGLARGSARRHVLKVLRGWSALQAVEADIPDLGEDRLRRAPIRVAHLDAALRFAATGSQERLWPVFAHFVTEGGAEPRTVLDIVEADGLALVRRDGAGARIVGLRELAPTVKGLLTEALLSTAPPDIALHAACLIRGGRALLLAGAPGAGKTTLTLALARAGFVYAGDDIALLDPAGRVRGAPFAPAVKSGAWRLLAGRWPDLARRPSHLRSDGVRVRYPVTPAPPMPDRLPVGWVVHLRRATGARARLLALEPAERLQRLVDEAHSAAGPASLGTMRMLIGVAEGARGFDFHYSDLDEAVRVLETACAEAAC